MPHVTVKMYRGRSEEDKARLAAEITKAVKASLGSGDDAISVGIEDIEPAAWAETVYRPEIVNKAGTIYKKPGYDPFR